MRREDEKESESQEIHKKEETNTAFQEEEKTKNEDISSLASSLANISIAAVAQSQDQKHDSQNKKQSLNNKQGIKYPILSKNNIDSIAHYIETNQPKKIIVMAGAGISTSAGIPDFRTPGTGLYSTLESFNLPTPESIFEISYFRKRPHPFYVLARDMWPGQYSPTTSHFFIRLLMEKGKLLRCYTQNIDTLERIAGIRADLLVEAHGSFAEASCVGGHLPESKRKLHVSGFKSLDSEDTEKSSSKILIEDSDDSTTPSDEFDSEDIKNLRKGCGKKYPSDYVQTAVQSRTIPTCSTCKGLVKPDIVFFGEQLPERFYKLCKSDFKECDLLIVMGTSLSVQPFASLIDAPLKNVPRLLINRDRVGEWYHASHGFDFERKFQKQGRDAFFSGPCDDGCFRLAQLLGWEKDLKSLIDNHKTSAVVTKL